MPLRDQIRRRRKDTRFILAMLALLLVPLTAIYYLLQSRHDLPSALVTNKVLLFVLWYIDVILILAVLFVLARNLFKLLLERRHRLLGSKFKSKLVATYIGLSLIPVLLLFLYASRLLEQSVDRWFAAPVRDVLQQGSAVAQGMLRLVETDTLHDAHAVADALHGVEVDLPNQRPALDRRLQAAPAHAGARLPGHLSRSDFVHGVVNPRAGLVDLPEPERAVLAEAALDGEAIKVQAPTEQGRLILAAAAMPESGTPPALVVAGACCRQPCRGRASN